jgi:Secretion system C-terminal sorting domain/Calx-beta domain
MSPADYTGICNGQLVFHPGETEKFILVNIKKDKIYENTEEFEVVLKDLVNASFAHADKGRRIAVVKIFNSPPDEYDCYGIEGKFTDITDQPLALEVKALPNPSNDYFQLKITSNGKGSIHLRVTDMQGRVLEDRKTENKMQQIRLGEKWRNGNYILELTQGDERKTIQLVKLR